MPDRDPPRDQATQDGQASRHTEPPKRPDIGRGYGRDFGAAGLNQGFDGSYGRGYAGSGAPSAYRAGEGDWIDQRVAQQVAGPHAGKGPRSWAPSDDRIREEVCERLLRDRLLDAREVEVAVRDGAVRLSGAVPGASDVEHAELLARGAPGVTSVENELRCEPGPRRIDRADHDEPQGQRTRWGKWIPPFTP